MSEVTNLLNAVGADGRQPAEELLALDEAIGRLQREHALKAELIKL